MRLFLLTALTMAAFAANSVLNRAALAGGHLGAMDFGTIRLVAGAVALAALVVALRRGFVLRGPRRLAGVAGLVLYIYGFSFAYLGLDAGLGALILFGTVQVTMFGGSLLDGERPPLLRWIGAALAFAGLAWLLWPGAGTAIPLAHGAAMVAAGIGWGVYSLAGRGEQDPLMATAANFVLAVPVGVLLAPLLPAVATPVPWTGWGLTLALVSGAVTSGLGYALWYAVLPRLEASQAAVAQLTVPVLAMAGGMMFLGEALTLRFAIASVIVLGGVAVSVAAGRRP